MDSEHKELEKQLNQRTDPERISKWARAGWELKVSSALIVGALASAPVVMDHCRDKNGYVDIAMFLGVEAVLVGIPVLYSIYKVWKL